MNTNMRKTERVCVQCWRTPGLRQHKLSLLVREEKVREDREEADGDDQFPS